MGLSAPERTIRQLLKECGATAVRTGGRNTLYSIPGAKETFLLDTGRAGDFRAAQNQLSKLRQLLRDRPTEFGMKVQAAVAGQQEMHTAATLTDPGPAAVPPPSNIHQLPRAVQPITSPKAASQPAIPNASTEWPADITQFQVKRLIIDDSTALEWLDRNTDNRNILDDHVNRLVRDMIAGEFVLNGETITFDTNGRLIDGQHRLWAVVESKVAIDILVVWGLKPSVYDTVNTGKSKKATDFLRADHVKNANVVAAVCRMVLYHEHGQLSKQKHGNLSPTVTEIQDVLRRHPELQESANWASGPVKKVTRPALAAFMHYMCSSKHPEAWVCFSQKWITGANLDPSDPVFHLRKRVLENRNRITTIDPVYLLGLTVKAWNLALRKRAIGALNIKEGEPFPEID